MKYLLWPKQTSLAGTKWSKWTPMASSIRAKWKIPQFTIPRPSLYIVMRFHPQDVLYWVCTMTKFSLLMLSLLLFLRFDKALGCAQEGRGLDNWIGGRNPSRPWNYWSASSTASATSQDSWPARSQPRQSGYSIQLPVGRCATSACYTNAISTSAVGSQHQPHSMTSSPSDRMCLWRPPFSSLHLLETPLY